MLKLFAASCLVVTAGALTPAAAEIVYLTSGRTVNVAGHRFEGDMVVLALRSGGEMVMARELVARVAPDEVPWVPPVPQVPAGSVPHVPVPHVQVLEAPAQFEALITKAAEAHAVDANLVRAVIKVECTSAGTTTAIRVSMPFLQRGGRRPVRSAARVGQQREVL